MTPLERARREAGLTQSALAQLAGIAQPTISRAERGKDPLVSHAIQIARALGTSVESLFAGAERADRAA